VGRRCRRWRLLLQLDVADGGLDSGDGIDYGFSVFGGGAAAAAYDSYAVIFYEMFVEVG